jgi:hypothetical protein
MLYKQFTLKGFDFLLAQFPFLVFAQMWMDKGDERPRMVNDGITLCAETGDHGRITTGISECFLGMIHDKS